MLKHIRLIVTGIVQGVGFRPFVYNLATQLNLAGEVSNSSSGVYIDLEGEEKSLEKFIETLTHNPPPLAHIQRVDAEEKKLAGVTGFRIVESSGAEERKTLISPDVAICPDCLAELNDPKDRRYQYPFINCTNCGPRYTIIEDIPYDRPKTTMKHFLMCSNCTAEYENAADRRFHAQPNACPDCGPQVLLINRYGEHIINCNPIENAAKLLKKGYIIGIKGLGGYHLACDATNDMAVQALRDRKYREDKPFAVMFANLSEVEHYCYLQEEERNIIGSIKRPIVLLLKKEKSKELADQVSPANQYLGAVLPYTPLHYVLFRYFHGPLVMTSANVSDEPIAYKDQDAMERLKDIADFFIIHDREIRHRCDDSVTRAFRGKEYLIRRARGYAPAPLILAKAMSKVLACGAEQKNTFCLTKGNYAFVSHHIGDLENMETLDSFTEEIELYKKLFEIEPEIIAYDLHPEYLSTKYALEVPGEKVAIQHHHAHIAGCMAENNLTDPVIGVAFDGTGFGTDGHLWGGEFLVADYKQFTRVAHLKYTAMPGGAKAIREPWRMAISHMFGAFDQEDLARLKLPLIENVGLPKIAMVREMIEKGINSPLTSSMGRLFDVAAALIDIRYQVNYEGQGALELEQRARFCKNRAGLLEYEFERAHKEDLIEIDPQGILLGIIEDRTKGISIETVALKFHYTVAKIIASVCLEVRHKYNINEVCLSGGVFQNLLLLERSIDLLEKQGFEVYLHRFVPTNDGGVSLGQAVIASERS